MSSRFAAPIVVGLFVLSLVSFTSGCGGGCDGSAGKNSQLLSKLPANLSAVVLIDVKRTINKEQIETFLTLARDSSLKAKVPDWVTSVTHLAVVMDWERDSKEPAPDCEAAADHLAGLMKKELGEDTPGDAVASMRAKLVKHCKAMPRMAPCMMKAIKLSDFSSCTSTTDTPPAFAAIVTGDFRASELIAAFAKEYPGRAQEGLDLVAGKMAFTALSDNVIAAGAMAMVKVVKAAWKGEAERLGADSPVMKLLTRVDREAAMVAAGHALTTLMKRSPVEEAAMSLTLDGESDLHYWMKADDALLGKAEAGLSKFKLGMSAVTAEQWATGLGLQDAAAAETMLAAVKKFADSAEAERDDGAMMITAEVPMDLSEFMALMSPLAVPAFTKYIRRAKTAEAIEGVEKIYKGAAAYFMTPRASAAGDTVLPCQFPKSVACTPTASPCDKGTDGKYPATDSATWADPTWAALSFERTEPHYFQYCFESSGTGSNAVFTVTAHGDLDCDGVLSTFKRSGSGVDAGDGNCTVKGGAFLKENETE